MSRCCFRCCLPRRATPDGPRTLCTLCCRWRPQPFLDAANRAEPLVAALMRDVAFAPPLLSFQERLAALRLVMMKLSAEGRALDLRGDVVRLWQSTDPSIPRLGCSVQELVSNRDSMLHWIWLNCNTPVIGWGGDQEVRCTCRGLLVCVSSTWPRAACLTPGCCICRRCGSSSARSSRRH